MRPSKLSKELYRVAAAIDNSKKPSKKLIARELNKIIAAVENVDFSADLSPIKSNISGTLVYVINGTYEGKVISGELVVLVENGVFAGYNEYKPSQNSHNFINSELEESVLEKCESDLMKRGIIHN